MPIASPRETFDRALQKLLDQVLVLGSMVEQAVQSALTALKQRDINTSRQIYAADLRVNEKRYQIETETIALIATQQPMARDVRFLRIVYYAKGISKIKLLIDDETIAPDILADLQRMADLGLGMLRRSLDAFVAQDAATARQIPLEDDQVDHLYNKIYRSLMDEMACTPASIDRANHLMWAAHNLERMADRVTNICERIVYVATGEMKELDTSDDEKRGLSE